MPDPVVDAARQALERALCLEVDGEEFYRQGALQASDGAARALYQHLMAAERAHLDLLMANDEAIVNEQYRSG